MVEEYLFFNQYKFHKQKLAFHRASMRSYEEFLHKHSYDVEYIAAQDLLSDIRKLISKLKTEGIIQIFYTEVVDDWLEKRLEKSASDNGIQLTVFNTPMFLNTKQELGDWFGNRKIFCITAYYPRF